MKISFTSLLLITCTYFGSCIHAANQTSTVDTPLLETTLPYTIRVAEANFSFPTVPAPGNTTTAGIQAFAFASYKNKKIFIAGRTAGLHWLNDTDSFLSTQQNMFVYVLDIDTKTFSYRSLEDISAGLTRADRDLLTPTATEFFQLEDHLYILGGYGYNNAISDFDTKSITRVIEIPKLIDWVENEVGTFRSCLTYIDDPYLQVTGGDAFLVNRHRPALLSLGHNFIGFYTLASNGLYTKQIRAFYPPNGNSNKIIKNKEYPEDPNYRRRDITIIHIMRKKDNTYVPCVVCLAGVFTTTVGAWTIPIIVDEDGTSYMQNTSDPNTMKQGMHSYNCAHISMFSIKQNKSFLLLFGGISFQYYENGTFITDNTYPFINNISTISIDENMNMQEYVMNAEFPTINYPNTSNPSYFGTYSQFFPTVNSLFKNGTIAFDKLESGEEILLGYIAGGIQSSARNTGGVPGTSIPSSHIFEVYLTKK